MFGAHAGARDALSLSLPAACSDHLADRPGPCHRDHHIRSVPLVSVPIFLRVSCSNARLRCSCTKCHHTAPAFAVVDTPHRQDARCVCVRVCHSSHAQVPEKSLNAYAMHVEGGLCVLVTRSEVREKCERSRSIDDNHNNNDNNNNCANF